MTAYQAELAALTLPEFGLPRVEPVIPAVVYRERIDRVPPAYARPKGTMLRLCMATASTSRIWPISPATIHALRKRSCWSISTPAANRCSWLATKAMATCQSARLPMILSGCCSKASACSGKTAAAAASLPRSCVMAGLHPASRLVRSAGSISHRRRATHRRAGWKYLHIWPIRSEP